ncbi:MAG: hypothetical protein WCY11_20945 [Novosphingobium sp.]
MAGITKRFGIAFVLGVSAMTGASACASAGLRLQCEVSGMDHVAGALSEDAICQTFAKAFASRTGSPVTRVDAAEGAGGPWAHLSLSIPNAMVMVARLRHGEGKAARDVPPMEVSISDSTLGPQQVEQLATSLAAELRRQ